MTIIFKRSGQFEIEIRLEPYIVILVAAVSLLRSVLASLGVLP